MKKAKTYKTIEFIVICVNTLIILESIYLYYSYNFTGKLYLFKYSNLFLLTNAFIGIIGIIISVMLIKKNVAIRLFLIVTTVFWLTVLLNYFFPAF